MKCNIAIIGATGLVGKQVIKILKEKGLTDHAFYLFADKNYCKPIKLGQEKYKIWQLTKKRLVDAKLNYALFCVDGEISKKYVQFLAKRGTVVIDFSAEFRHKYPLIVPEINAEKINGNIICNPNCSTIISVMALNEINKQFGLEEIVYSSYQAVSGAGSLALRDMNKTNPNKLKSFEYCIKNNLIPIIGKLAKNGYSTEENKMIFETKKILNLSATKMSATCVRVPITIGHSISINFKTKSNANLQQIKQLVAASPNVTLQEYTLPMPQDARKNDNVLVGRIRHAEQKNTFDMFVCGNNLRKGAALNGVQILELLIRGNK